MKCWCDCISAPMPDRTDKVRTKGITMVMDKGLGPSRLEDFLRVAADFIDIIKLTAGTALLCEHKIIEKKLALLKKWSVDVMLGGTLTEIALHQGTYNEFLTLCKELGSTIIEVADGSIELPLKRRRDAVKQAADMGFRVITEVGKEDPAEALSVQETIKAVLWDIESGASLVTMEAREFGNVGVYDKDGTVRQDLFSEIKKEVPDLNMLLWEAPLFQQQLDLIRLLGSNVNLGNIQPDDILRLETIRRGLIGDTFRDTLRTI